MWLDHLDHEANDRARGEKLAALLTLASGELGKEVFVNLAEQIAGSVGWNVGEMLEKLVRNGSVTARQASVLVLGQDTFELGLVLLDRFHRLLEFLGDVFFLRKVQQVVIARMVR